MFSKSARNANTSSIGLLIVTVFSKVATSRSSVRTPRAYRPSGHRAETSTLQTTTDSPAYIIQLLELEERDLLVLPTVGDRLVAADAPYPTVATDPARVHVPPRLRAHQCRKGNFALRLR